jgi:hypothetical protein
VGAKATIRGPISSAVVCRGIPPAGVVGQINATFITPITFAAFVFTGKSER